MEIPDLARVIAFVLPGYLATELRNLLVRTKKRDNFERLASCLFISLVAYVLAAATVYPFCRADWQRHLRICWENWPFVLLLYAVALLIGYLLARASRSRRLEAWLYRRGYDVSSRHPNVWNEIWHSEKQAPWVIVRMKDGTESFGAVRAYTADPDDEKRELWLFPVAKSADPEEDFQVVPGLSLYVPAAEITSISVYRPDDRPAPT